MVSFLLKGVVHMPGNENNKTPEKYTKNLPDKSAEAVNWVNQNPINFQSSADSIRHIKPNTIPVPPKEK